MRFAVGTVLLSLAACGRKPDAEPPVTVYAASSLREVATEIAAAWSKSTGRPHRLEFEATSTLARQIQEGAPADVFLTAAPEWLDDVKPLERYEWLSNRLVVVVPKDAPLADDEEKVQDWLRDEVLRIALANEHVPAGKYAHEALARMGVVTEDRAIYGQNVRDVLQKVVHGAAEAGVVYATDARIEPAVRVVYTFSTGPNIVYSVGLVRLAGKALFEAFRGEDATRIAVRHGFIDARSR